MKLLAGDCLTVLKKLPDNSVDSLVTDPPAGISFMGKDWDHHKGGRREWISWMCEVMTEVFRVLKPGAHGLVWAIPRTSHWTATALEDAGFEVRDVVTHLFGSGFPKSMDISKAIDKAAGAERTEVIKKVTRSGPTHSPESISRGNIKPAGVPKLEYNVCAPATDSAREWQGWGTALKPASEHWILVRKPCSEKTVASNVQKWGTGAINIDASRIGTTDKWSVPKDAKPRTSSMAFEGKKSPNSDSLVKNRAGAESSPLGRFPANLVLTEGEATEALDAQSGTLKSGARNGVKRPHNDFGTFQYKEHDTGQNFKASEGGASRFFYCAKISTSERGEGNTHPTVKPKKLMSYLIRMITPPGGVVLDPFMGSGSTGLAAHELGFDFIGIEKEREYLEIAQARIKGAKRGKRLPEASA